MTAKCSDRVWVRTGWLVGWQFRIAEQGNMTQGTRYFDWDGNLTGLNEQMYFVPWLCHWLCHGCVMVVPLVVSGRRCSRAEGSMKCQRMQWRLCCSQTGWGWTRQTSWRRSLSGPPSTLWVVEISRSKVTIGHHQLCEWQRWVGWNGQLSTFSLTNHKSGE